jgi:hypothetical protein
MADEKVVVNLAAGLEEGERVIVAFLVATAALERLAGATPLWQWIGEGATVFSY